VNQSTGLRLSTSKRKPAVRVLFPPLAEVADDEERELERDEVVREEDDRRDEEEDEDDNDEEDEEGDDEVDVDGADDEELCDDVEELVVVLELLLDDKSA